MTADNRLPARDALPAGEAPVLDIDCARVIRRGLWLLVLGFGGFMGWTVLAPLDEGVPAAGTVAVETSRKRVDHPGGGVIDRILVREGQRVEMGDELLTLNPTQATAALRATQGQWASVQAALARLTAEREGADSIRFPDELQQAAATDRSVVSQMRIQEALFRSRRLALQGELRMIRESTLGLEAQMSSLARLAGGRQTQVSLFKEQLESFQRLKQEGFVSRNYLLEVERQLAEVQSRQSEDMSNTAGVGARLSEFRVRGSQREVEFRREVEAQLAELQREAAVLAERLAAQRDTVEHLRVRAPVAGVVVDLAFHTEGGVIKPGDRIVDVVPERDPLIVEAQLAPQYIDRLQAGMPADVHFDAYSSRRERPVIRGNVEVVSADALIDKRTGAAYYAIRVGVPPEERARLGGLKLQPGMPATVMIKTGERSLAALLLRPLMRRFDAALAE